MRAIRHAVAGRARADLARHRVRRRHRDRAILKLDGAAGSRRVPRPPFALDVGHVPRGGSHRRPRSYDLETHTRRARPPRRARARRAHSSSSMLAPFEQKSSSSTLPFRSQSGAGLPTVDDAGGGGSVGDAYVLGERRRVDRLLHLTPRAAAVGRPPEDEADATRVMDGGPRSAKASSSPATRTSAGLVHRDAAEPAPEDWQRARRRRRRAAGPSGCRRRAQAACR